MDGDFPAHVNALTESVAGMIAGGTVDAGAIVRLLPHVMALIEKRHKSCAGEYKFNLCKAVVEAAMRQSSMDSSQVDGMMLLLSPMIEGLISVASQKINLGKTGLKCCA